MDEEFPWTTTPDARRADGPFWTGPPGRQPSPPRSFPWRVYDLSLLTTGAVTVRAHLASRNAALSDAGLRYAVSFDDAPSPESMRPA
ncbi:hypothetical protein AB0K68_33785 [Streptomyces sp. NPDC050698]